MLPRALLLFLALAACRKEETTVVDLDQDGALSDTDCDDTNATVFPGAAEVCDSLDNDCDEEIDEEATDTQDYYQDIDGDGHGNAGAPTAACQAPAGYVATGDDCDDSAASVFPGAPEADCTDPTDYNCDGSTGYADADADGHPACQDCDDSLAERFPGNPEQCDDLDNDCDEAIDEDAEDATPFFADLDGDGWGDPDRAQFGCTVPEGYVSDASDCDDLHAASHPGGAEVCDGHDNDCDGGVDVGASDASTWYPDADGDLFGAAQGATVACQAPQGAVSNAMDCDDSLATVRPGGGEVCDLLDNDCDGATDESAADALPWYGDADEDGFGAGAVLMACQAPAGAVDNRDDCDDSLAAVSPDADERCDTAYDDDCDRAVNEGNAIDAARWHLDADGDSHGRADVGTLACLAPAGHMDSHDDCDDLDDSVFPGAPERCDGLANTCGALPSDEADLDGDGFLACDDDCDDSLAAVHPGANERCNDNDDDCDGSVDEGAIDPSLWHLDLDGDGHGQRHMTREACAAPADYTALGDDCDDANEEAFPGQRELPGNGFDDDCDGESVALLTVSVSRYSGEMWALDSFTGALAWRVGGLGELIDVVRADDGTYYAGRLDGDLVAVPEEGSTFSIVETGLSGTGGLWYDRHTDTLLVVNSSGGEIAEVNPVSGAVTVLASGLDNPVHAIRFAGDTAIYATFADAQEVRRFTPATGTWEVLGHLHARPYLMVPANDGGLWIGDGANRRLAHLSRRGLATWQAVSERIYGICADPTGSGALYAGNHDDAVVRVSTDDAVCSDLAADLNTPWGCTSNSLADWDEDGFAARALGGDDCDDLDAAIHPGASDPWGDGEDSNCDFSDGTDDDDDGSPADHGIPACADQDDGDPAVLALPECARRDCAATLATRGPGTPSGTYTLDPSEDGDLSDAYEAYCEMGLAGGGWTLAAKFSNQDAKHWVTADEDWAGATPYGLTSDLSAGADAKGPAWGAVLAQDFMLTDHLNPTDSIATLDHCVGGQPLARYFAGVMGVFPASATAVYDVCDVAFTYLPNWGTEPDWNGNTVANRANYSSLYFPSYAPHLTIGFVDGGDTGAVISLYHQGYNEADVGLGALEDGPGWSTAGAQQDVGGPTSCNYDDAQCRTEYPETVFLWVR